MATNRVRLPDRPPSEGCGSAPLTIKLAAEQPFLPTREHSRFIEFAEACSRYRYIGVCHGRPGVGRRGPHAGSPASPNFGVMAHTTR